MNKVQIFTCGGTIDKDYGSGKEVYDFHIGEPCIGKILDDLNIPKNHYEVIELMRKDSLDMKSEDRQLIFEKVSESKIQKIMMTHGTDRMVDTAEVVKSIQDKIIIIVGASRPYSMKETDAEENIGFAWDELQKQSKTGVYIAMNSLLIPGHLAEKQSDGNFINLLD